MQGWQIANKCHLCFPEELCFLHTGRCAGPAAHSLTSHLACPYISSGSGANIDAQLAGVDSEEHTEWRSKQQSYACAGGFARLFARPRQSFVSGNAIDTGLTVICRDTPSGVEKPHASGRRWKASLRRAAGAGECPGRAGCPPTAKSLKSKGSRSQNPACKGRVSCAFRALHRQAGLARSLVCASA
jgi:hypothetical protein